MKKFLIFDFDGTMIDSRDVIIQRYNEIADRDHYKKIDKLDVVTLSNLSIAERCKILHIPMYKIPSIALEVRKQYKKDLPNLRIKDQVAELLYKLKTKGFRLGIISSNEKSNIMEFLKLNDLDIFESVFSEKNIFGKHHAIHKFIKKLNLEIGNTIYIGDEVRDIISCKKVSIKVIAVTWGYDSLPFLLENKPDFIAEHPEEILNIVNNYFPKNS